MNRLEQLCEQRGLRLNGKRRLILQVLAEANDHPTVEEIYRRTLLRDAEISLATIYRTLNILTAAGILTRLGLGDGKTRYEDADGGRHEHLVDVRSGAVVEFREPGIETLIRDAAAILGYSLLDYHLEVFAETQTNGAPEGGARPPAAAETSTRSSQGAAAAGPPSRLLPGARIASQLAHRRRTKPHARP